MKKSLQSTSSSRYFLPQMFNQLQHELNQLFSLVPSENQDMYQMFQSEWLPACDIENLDNKIIFTLEIPGVDLKDVDISLENNRLIIQGEKETTSKKEEKHLSTSERYYGHFYREFQLPNNIDEKKISALCKKNGLLEITIPKTKESLTQKIKIKEE